MNRSLTPVKGRSLTPLGHRAHGPLPHFESNSCTGHMSRVLNPFMRRSLTLFMDGLLRIFLMDPCHISRRGVALFDGQCLLQDPACIRAHGHESGSADCGYGVTPLDHKQPSGP